MHHISDIFLVLLLQGYIYILRKLGWDLSFQHISNPFCLLCLFNLYGANLKGAKLEGTKLGRAHLERAYLIETNLEGAYLIKTNFQGANLQGANFKWT